MPYTNSFKQPNTQPRWLEMVKTIDFKDATKKIRQLLKEMTEKDNRYIIRSNGQNIAVLISFGDYRNFTDSAAKREQAKQRFFKMVDKIHQRTKDVPLTEIEDAVSEAVAFAKKEELKEMEQA